MQPQSLLHKGTLTASPSSIKKTCGIPKRRAKRTLPPKKPIENMLSNSTPGRPPASPKSLRCNEGEDPQEDNTVQTIDADLVAIALLSAEARRRSGLMMRERDYIWLHGGRASPLLLSRVRMLEKDVRGIVKTIAKTRARVSAAYCAARFPPNGTQMAR